MARKDKFSQQDLEQIERCNVRKKARLKRRKLMRKHEKAFQNAKKAG